MASSKGFKLYVWAPIHGAPSLDPECVAVILFLTKVLPSDARLSIVTTYDASISPSGTLPCLRGDDLCIHGRFRNFLKYFQLPGEALDDGVEPRQQAEALALGYHTLQQALPLLEYHLYINRDNYSDVTHPAQSRYSYWPFGWLYLSHRFDKAERRAASAGLADQPVGKKDTTSEDTDPAAGGHLEGSDNPSLLFARSQKAKKRLKEQVNRARFRLEDAIDTLCEPLNAALQHHTYLIDDRLRSVDCQVCGYLILLSNSNVCDTTIPDAISMRWPRVVDYAARVGQETSVKQTSLAPNAQESAVSDGPSSIQQPPGLIKRASVFLTSLANLIISPPSRSHLNFTLRTVSLTAPIMFLGIFAASTGIATFVYGAKTLLGTKIPRDALNQRSFTFARPRTGLGAMGASGAALAALIGPPLGSYNGRASMKQERTMSGDVTITESVKRQAPQVVEVAEVDVEVK
ncbi:MAG: hypothetical protein Q9159_002346 [Coniocarpon cinnabarinum]